MRHPPCLEVGLCEEAQRHSPRVRGEDSKVGGTLEAAGKQAGGPVVGGSEQWRSQRRGPVRFGAATSKYLLVACRNENKNREAEDAKRTRRMQAPQGRLGHEGDPAAHRTEPQARPVPALPARSSRVVQVLPLHAQPGAVEDMLPHAVPSTAARLTLVTPTFLQRIHTHRLCIVRSAQRVRPAAQRLSVGLGGGLARGRMRLRDRRRQRRERGRRQRRRYRHRCRRRAPADVDR